MVHDWAKGISRLFGHIWCRLGNFVLGPSVVRARRSAIRPNRSGLYPDDSAMYGATCAVCAWTRVESDGPVKYVCRSVTNPDGLS
jgi:hypothetical protein